MPQLSSYNFVLTKLLTVKCVELLLALIIRKVVVTFKK